MRDDNDQERGVDARVEATEAVEEKEAEEEDAADLPRREAMSLLLDPTALLGAGTLPISPTGTTTPTAAPTPADPSAVPTPGGTINVPHVPLPETNPGGTYNPDTTSTSST